MSADEQAFAIPLRSRVVSAALEDTLSDGRYSRTLHLALEADERRTVRIPTGEISRQARWEISIHDAPPRPKDELSGRLGRVNYYPPKLSDDPLSDDRDEIVSAWVNIPPDCFANVVTAVRSPGLTCWLTLEVLGLDYGWEPDGHSVEWDLTKNKHLRVTSFNLASSEALAEDPREQPEPLVGQSTHSQVVLNPINLRPIERRLGWIMILLALAIVLSTCSH